ncbi:hypothetical protein [Streptomyces sp. NPDC049881]|uniref:hypothetical protein n=1 Tax=Streptomyces sp. NPDC049881 TaxID=3155778 RepID=UPI0034451E3F
MSAPDRAPHTGRLAPYALDLELSLLLSSAAPPGWRSAVEEAAHLLSERYTGAWAELHTLALLLFARTYTGDRTPRDVPVEELRQALDDPSAGENGAVAEIRQALDAVGQGYNSDKPDDKSPLRLIFGPLADRYGGSIPWSDEWDPVPPRPSPLDHAAERLVSYLAAYEAGHRDSPSSVPAVGDGPLYLEAETVFIASRNSLVPPLSAEGRVSPVRRLTIDGPVVVCGTDQRQRQLDPAQVRLAVARTLGVAPSVQGAYTIPGTLYVPCADLSRGADPYEFNWTLHGLDDHKKL